MGTKMPLSTRLLSAAKISANQRGRPLKRWALLGLRLIRRIGGQQIRQATMLGGISLPGPRPWAGETRKPSTLRPHHSSLATTGQRQLRTIDRARIAPHPRSSDPHPRRGTRAQMLKVISARPTKILVFQSWSI